MEIGRNYNTSKEDLLQNIRDLWIYYDRQPKYAEVVKPVSKYSISSYENKFGSWRLALQEFIKQVNTNTDKEADNIESISQVIELNEAIATEIKKTKKEIKIKRTPRGINKTLRYKVFKRDNSTCQICGRTRKNDGIVLHVDHIIPWSKGGETVIENLQTLCQECNLGKSNLL